MMKDKFMTLLLTAALTGMSACGSSGDEPAVPDIPPGQLTATMPEKTNKMKVLVHYMPWFETNTSNSLNPGTWGWHWTMNATLNPANGEIASHYHPLTGAYASGDAAILDYQCLLMKYSGIDGVIVDWYGANADNTTARHTSNTEALMRAIAKAGMELSICYEDQTIAKASDKVGAGRIDMGYLSQNFFGSAHYTKVNGDPLLLCFGPQGVTSPKEWYRIFQITSHKPFFVVLNGNTARVNDNDYTNAQGEFLWVNADPASWYAAAQKTFGYVMGGAMPGFWDYYKEGKAGDGYTTYDRRDGALYTSQLSAAKVAGLDCVQVSTWNDYGEGTVIEPTTEFGYKYLTLTQAFTGVSYGEDVLKNIYRWYTLRVKWAGNASLTSTLDRVYDYFNALLPDKAVALMNTIDQ